MQPTGITKNTTLPPGDEYIRIKNIQSINKFKLTATKRIFIFIFLFLISFKLIGSSSSVYDNNPAIRQAHQYLYALRPLSAEKLLKQEEIKNPGNAYVIFYRMYSEMISLLISNSPDRYKKAIPKLNEYVAKLEKLPDNAPDYRLLLGDAKVLTGLLNVKYNNKFAGLIDCLKGYNLLEDNIKKYPQFRPDEKIPGIIKIGVAFMPPMLRWGSKLFGIKSNPQEGLKDLSDFAGFAKGKQGYDQESLLFMMAAYKLMNRPEAAMKMIKDNMDGFKEIVVLNFIAATVCLDANDAETALLLLSRIEPGKMELDLPQLLYLTGKAKLLRLDPDTDIPLIAYLKKSNGPDYMKATLYNLACFYYISGNTTKYRSYIEQVKTKGREFLSRDMEAAFEARQPGLPDINLMKADFLVKGGYYSKASSELSKALSNTLSPDERVGYHYLKAECNRLGNLDKQAESEYLAAVSLGKSTGNHIAQKALVQAGLMMEENGLNSEAEKYYNQCLEFDATSNPYSDLYKNKAKAGLIRLSLSK